MQWVSAERADLGDERQSQDRNVKRCMRREWYTTYSVCTHMPIALHQTNVLSLSFSPSYRFLACGHPRHQNFILALYRFLSWPSSFGFFVRLIDRPPSQYHHHHLLLEWTFSASTTAATTTTTSSSATTLNVVVVVDNGDGGDGVGHPFFTVDRLLVTEGLLISSCSGSNLFKTMASLLCCPSPFRRPPFHYSNFHQHGFVVVVVVADRSRGGRSVAVVVGGEGEGEGIGGAAEAAVAVASVEPPANTTATKALSCSRSRSLLIRGRSQWQQQPPSFLPCSAFIHPQQ